MKFKISSKLQYKINDFSTIILNIYAAKTKSQTIITEALDIDPHMEAEELDNIENDNRSIRINTKAVESLIIKYEAEVDSYSQLIDKSELKFIPVSQLSIEVIPFLYQSRYCQSDKLLRYAQNKFGHINHAYDQVYEICNWIRNNVAYTSGSTDSETSAIDTITEREGVCRDFAHLGIALCRALTIPARYLSCYAYKLEPPDFHACFEAYLGGKWIVFDPTELAPLNGLVKIGTGRDATDISVANIFGNTSLNSMEVINEVQDKNFYPLFMKDLKDRGVAL